MIPGGRVRDGCVVRVGRKPCEHGARERVDGDGRPRYELPSRAVRRCVGAEARALADNPEIDRHRRRQLRRLPRRIGLLGTPLRHHSMTRCDEGGVVRGLRIARHPQHRAGLGPFAGVRLRRDPRGEAAVSRELSRDHVELVVRVEDVSAARVERPGACLEALIAGRCREADVLALPAGGAHVGGQRSASPHPEPVDGRRADVIRVVCRERETAENLSRRVPGGTRSTSGRGATCDRSATDTC